MSDVEFDWQREQRTGIAEAVLCAGKTLTQLTTILTDANERKQSILLTRLDDALAPPLLDAGFNNLQWVESAGLAVLNNGLAEPVSSDCLIVTAGSSDMPVALEAQQTLQFYGVRVQVLADCGVAGLWRLTDKLPQLRAAPVIIAVAGMEGALFSVLAGLVSSVVIAVPRSTGYGVAEGGHAALSSALAGCAPGVVTVNIDNGFGAACALLKILRWQKNFAAPDQEN